MLHLRLVFFHFGLYFFEAPNAALSLLNLLNIGKISLLLDLLAYILGIEEFLKLVSHGLICFQFVLDSLIHRD